MAQSLECLTALLEAADPAVQVPPEVSRRVAQRLQDDIGRWLPLFGAETDLQQLLPLQRHCSNCNAALSRCDSLKTTAVILHTTGPIRKQHVPVRCRNRACQRCSVLLWHNYSVESGKHVFTGFPHDLKCFMLTSSFGFSTAWLRQFHSRLVRQHASFISESDVVRENACAEGQQHLLPTARLRLLISEGWFKWRFLLRASTCGVTIFHRPSPKHRTAARTCYGSFPTAVHKGSCRQGPQRKDALRCFGHGWECKKQTRRVCLTARRIFEVTFSRANSAAYMPVHTSLGQKLVLAPPGNWF